MNASALAGRMVGAYIFHRRRAKLDIMDTLTILEGEWQYTVLQEYTFTEM